MREVLARAALGAATGVLVLLAAAGVAQAGARRPGLAGNLLIEDADDVFLFPQRLIAYPNLVALAYGGTAGSGNGLLSLGGDGWAFGVALHRGDVLAPHAIDELTALDGPSSLFPGALSLEPATIVDALVALDPGGYELGLRLAAGAAGDHGEEGGRETGLSNTFASAELGWGQGTRGQGVRTEVSLTFGFERAQRVLLDDEVGEGTRLHVSALARAYFPLDATLDLGALASLGGSSGSYRDDSNPSPDDVATLNALISGGAGPALRLGRASVAGYGLLRFELAREDPEAEKEDDARRRHTIAVPALQIAFELPIGEWFTLRSGAEYAFELVRRASPDAAGSSEREGRFSWNLGFGLSSGDFRFDASLQHGFVTGGPSFLGGGEPGFLAIASASYSFDAARKAATAAAPPAAAPIAPAPETAPADAPAPAHETAPAPAPAPAPTPGPAAPAPAAEAPSPAVVPSAAP